MCVHDGVEADPGSCPSVMTCMTNRPRVLVCFCGIGEKGRGTSLEAFSIRENSIACWRRRRQFLPILFKEEGWDPSFRMRSPSYHVIW